MRFNVKSRALPANLRAIEKEVKAKAKAIGLDFWDIIFEILESSDLNEIAAYGGFPTRYPHWKFGMEYDQLIKGYAYGLSKIYELVINNDPCIAYLMKQNSVTDQKLVMAHVCGHADFFKNNYWFAHTNRKMVDQMANHAVRIRKISDKHGRDKVENFTDICLSLENLIDMYSPFIARKPKKRDQIDETRIKEEVSKRKLKARDYMDRYINPADFLAEQNKRIEEKIKKQVKVPEEPERDVLGFLLEHAPLKDWQKDILGIIREEAYYFAPQGMTKIMNEGWACVRKNTPIFTENGLITMGELVAEKAAGVVSDGEENRKVYDRNIIKDHPTIKIITKRGFILEGSDNHRIMLPNEKWRRLDELNEGDNVRIACGMQIWPSEYIKVDWSQPEKRYSLADVAKEAGVSQTTISRYRSPTYKFKTQKVALIEKAMIRYNTPENQALSVCYNKRDKINIPEVVNEDLATLLGFLVGDGNVTRRGRVITLTSGDYESIERYCQIVERVFGKAPVVRKCDTRWRAHLYSLNAIDFLENYCEIKIGRAARRKVIPQIILQSPKSVIVAFLTSYYDSDGYAGESGVILSTSSEKIAKTLQILLLNFGILSTRKKGTDDCYQIYSGGENAKIFFEQIGFNLGRKTDALENFIEDRQWFCSRKFEDEIVYIEPGQANVYDISVEETHRYVASGFINHNSYNHSKLMTEHGLLTDQEVIHYADCHAGTMASNGGLNPYKIGIELLRDIEDRWNKGKFGPEWDRCEDMLERKKWDKKLGKGRDKIFQVRKIYNDVTFIETFLTEDFCKEHKLFIYDYNQQTDEYVITSRDFEKIKERFLKSLVNFGQPVIEVDDSNYKNRGELYLIHKHDGTDLKVDYALDCLSNLYHLWTRPVNLETLSNGKKVILSYDGTKHREENLE